MTIIIFMLFLTLGMFTKNLGGSASAEIAKPYASIVDVKLNDANVPEGDSGTYEFAVKNTDKDGTKISEVAMSYSLKIVTDTNNYDSSKVSYKLIDVDNSNTEITTKDSDGWYSDSNMQFDVVKKANGDLETQTHKYKIEFTPQSEGTLNFKVKIEAKQID